jgi:hypothetical protein
MPPVGKALSVYLEDNRLKSPTQFATREIYPFADTIFQLVDGGFMRATSVGFIPKEWEETEDEERLEAAGWFTPLDFTKQELLEYSIVPVPSNPEALLEARSKGIDTSPIRSWAEEALDGYYQTKGGLWISKVDLEALRKQADPKGRTYVPVHLMISPDQQPTNDFVASTDSTSSSTSDTTTWMPGTVYDPPMTGDLPQPVPGTTTVPPTVFPTPPPMPSPIPGDIDLDSQLTRQMVEKWVREALEQAEPHPAGEEVAPEPATTEEPAPGLSSSDETAGGFLVRALQGAYDALCDALEEEKQPEIRMLILRDALQLVLRDEPPVARLIHWDANQGCWIYQHGDETVLTFTDEWLRVFGEVYRLARVFNIQVSAVHEPKPAPDSTGAETPIAPKEEPEERWIELETDNDADTALDLEEVSSAPGDTIQTVDA